MMFEQTLFKVLLFLSVCICNGAPPKQIGKRSSNSCGRYNVEEDKFIIEAVLKILDGSKPVFSTQVWNKVAEMHKQMRKANPEGFQHGRTPDSLRKHFKGIVLANPSEYKVPEALRQKIIQGESKHRKGGLDRHSLTPQEIDFIFNELRKPSCTAVYSVSTIEKLRAEHEKNRLAKKKGFEIDSDGFDDSAFESSGSEYEIPASTSDATDYETTETTSTVRNQVVLSSSETQIPRSFKRRRTNQEGRGDVHSEPETPALEKNGESADTAEIQQQVQVVALNAKFASGSIIPSPDGLK